MVGSCRRLVLPATIAVIAASLSGCIGFNDKLFFGWDDRRVLCGQSIDDVVNPLDIGQVLGRMDDAAANRQVYNIYAHVPGESVTPELIDRILGEAEERQLDFVTYHDMFDRSDPRAGLALAFDDASIDEWSTLRDTFSRHGARVTFFVTRYYNFSDQGKAELQALAADGHDIEAHGVDHLDAPKYVAEHGLDAYLQDEALPSIDQLVADGYPVRAYAYPFGARSDELDRALLQHVQLVRTTPGPCPW